MKSKAGSFSTGTGALDTTQEITIGFQAKVIFFWWSGQTSATDAVTGGDHYRGLGVATSTSARYSFTTYSQDAQGSSVGASYMHDAEAITTVANDGTLSGALDVSAIGATSFTVIVDDVMPLDLRIHYLALGGDDVVNAACGIVTSASSIYTVSGLGFQPNFAMLLGQYGAGTPPFGTNNNGIFTLGIATDSTNQVALSAGEDDGSSTMDTGAWCTAAQMFAHLSAAVGTAISARQDFNTFTAGGFTTTNETAYVAVPAIYVALNCTNVIVGNSLTQTDTTTDITVSGLGWKPAAGLVISHCRAEPSGTTLTRTDKTSIGAFTSTTERVAHGVRDEDNVADSNVAIAVEHDEVYVHIADTNDELVGLMDVKSVDSGGVTFIMDDADPAQAYFGYVLFGPAESGATNIAPTEASQSQTSDAAVGIPIYIIAPAEGTQSQLSDAASVNAIFTIAPIEAWQFQLSDPAVISFIPVIAPAEASQSQTSDAAQLKAVYLVTPTEASQSQASDAASIKAIYVIAPTEASQQQSSDAAAISQAVQIAPAEASQSQTSDAAVLKATYIVAPSEATQNQASDAASLTAIYVIAPTEASQSQVSDAAELTRATNIAVSEATQVQTSDAASLKAIHVIAPAEASQSQSSDAAAIAAVHVIAPSEATQSQTSDVAALAAIYMVAPAEASQSQTSDAASISFIAGGETIPIAPAEATQNQASDAASLKAVYLLTAGEAAQTQTSDAAVISFIAPTYNIAPAEASQAQAMDVVTAYSIYLLAVAEATQAQIGDGAAMTVVQMNEHGERRLYEMNARGTNALGSRTAHDLAARGDSVFVARPTHEVATREDLEVDD